MGLGFNNHIGTEGDSILNGDTIGVNNGDSGGHPIIFDSSLQDIIGGGQLFAIVNAANF